MEKYSNDIMRRCVAGYLIAAVILVLASCSSNTEVQLADQAINHTPEERFYELSKTQFESSEMQLGKMEMKIFHKVVKANGLIDVPPENRASVGSYFGGTVKVIRLLPGERVKKGQHLFTLENPDFVQTQQDFLEAKGQLSYLKSDYERQKNLAQDNISSQKNFLKAESDYTVIRVKVASLRKKLTLMNINPDLLTLENIRTTINITSPINGYVTQVGIARGAFLNPSQSAITIVDTDHLHLELNIFEKDLSKVSKGQPIRFRIQENNDKEYKALVYLISKEVDPESRMIGIHGHLVDEKQSSMFNPGMYVEAEIYSASVSKASLPEDALVELEGKYYVLALHSTSNNGYKLVRKVINAGEINDGFVEILNSQDFNDSVQFLTKGAFNLITE
ncbi:MAG TPA: efflux RND transporter periplasmic adaptor subunit [Fulvivirga sp.]|nr:efflux RND transporter periplasmic adaptor subunit [Fulvivirga sp.]